MSIDNTAMLTYDANKKSVGIAYLLLVFLGWLGIHNFYLDRSAVGLIQLFTAMGGLFFIISGGTLNAMEHVGQASTAGLIGTLCWVVNWILWTIDLFSLWHFVKKHNLILLSSLNKGGFIL